RGMEVAAQLILLPPADDRALVAVDREAEDVWPDDGAAGEELAQGAVLELEQCQPGLRRLIALNFVDVARVPAHQVQGMMADAQAGAIGEVAAPRARAGIFLRVRLV